MAMDDDIFHGAEGGQGNRMMTASNVIPTDKQGCFDVVAVRRRRAVLHAIVMGEIRACRTRASTFPRKLQFGNSAWR